MNAAVVTIGDELLAGRTQNTNATWLARRLTERGVQVERVTTLPDHVGDIARVVNEYRADYDAVLVTGGLGPTHDDVTIEGVAAAVGRPLEHSEKALEWLLEEGGYSNDELTDGTVELPAGSEPIHNTAGVAPGFVLENIYVLPGIPEEMKAMFERIQEAFNGEPIHRSVVLATEPESELLEPIDELTARYDVSVGSYPGESVRVSIEGTDETVVKEAVDWFEERVETRQQ